jgi:hypothetical protein
MFIIWLLMSFFMISNLLFGYLRHYILITLLMIIRDIIDLHICYKI